jgi:hypothetical protein
LQESGSVGRVSDRRLAADRAFDPAIGSAGRVGFGSSWVFPFMGTSEQRIRVGVVPIKEKWQFALSPPCDGQPDTFWFAFPHSLFSRFI